MSAKQIQVHPCFISPPFSVTYFYKARTLHNVMKLRCSIYNLIGYISKYLQIQISFEKSAHTNVT